MIFSTVLLLSLAGCQGLYFEVEQGPEYRIYADTLFNLTLSFREISTSNQSDLVSSDLPLGEGLVVWPSPEEDWHLTFENASVYFTPEELQDGTQKILWFSAYYWGYWPLSFYGRPPSKGELSSWARTGVFLIKTETKKETETGAKTEIGAKLESGTRAKRGTDTAMEPETEMDKRLKGHGVERRSVDGVDEASEDIFGYEIGSGVARDDLLDSGEEADYPEEDYPVLYNQEMDYHGEDHQEKDYPGENEDAVLMVRSESREDKDLMVRSGSRGVKPQQFLLTNNTLIVVDRKQSSKVMDDLFVGTATLLMLTNTVNMGCQLDPQIIMAVLKKPIGPAVGVVSQFFCMPMFSFLIGYLLLDNTLQRLGLFVLGCCPGGSASNFWTLLFNGDINLSITMTFISTIIAMVMMPFWMMTLGSLLITEENSFEIPYLNLIASLIALTIPICIGMLIKYKKPSWAVISGKIVKPMTFGMVTFFITVGMWNNHKAMMMLTWRMAGAGLTVALGGYTAGACLSLLFCLKKKQIIAISIETAFQNAAIAVILIKLSLETPDSDLATVPAMAQIFQTGPPLLFVYLGWQVLQKFGLCLPDVEDTDLEAGGEVEKENDTTAPLVLVPGKAVAGEKLDPLNPFHDTPPAYPDLPPYSEKA